MVIYSDKDKQILEVEVDDNSYRHRVIMGDYNITLYYSLAEHVELPVGAYCIYQGERYTLKRPEAFKMKHSRNFEYTVTMESGQADAKMWKFRNPVDGRLKFSLTAKPHEHLQMFVDNMNRRDTGWEVGQCVEGDEVCISYDHVYCYDALSQMASKLGTEFEFVGKTVHLHKVEYNKNNPLPLSYGRGNGFKPNVGRENYGDTPPVEILYVQGGTDNIDASKYGSSELLLPKSQVIGFDGEKFSDEEGFNSSNARWYITDNLGYSIRRSDKEVTSLAEDSLDCSDIYPKRVGTISSVEVVDKENNFYDIIDDSIPESLNYEECLIEGETMTVIFQSGMLAGKEFEVKYYHEAILNSDGTVKKAGRRFEIVPQEIDGQTMPNETFTPRGGNTYAVFHCMLPKAYVCDDNSKSGASWDMFRKGVKYLFDNEETKFTFSGELDGIWSKKDWVNIGGKIRLGGYIRFSDERFQKEGVLVRITGIKDYINKPYSPELELSNNTVGTSFSTKLKELESTEVIAEDYRREALQFTKRRFRDAQETMKMLEDALLDNFTQSISPIAIQTMQMLVGDESLQFRFVNSKTNPVAVSHNVTYDAANKQLHVSAGIIQHMTLGIDTISSTHAASEYKYWDVAEYTSARLDDGTKKYYLYAKVSKTAQTGEFLLSETAIKMEAVTGYYHLLVGILNSEYDGERSFATLYGFSEILPGRVTTDKVVSGDGNSYFDMLNNAMKLGDALDFNSKGDGKLRIKGTIVQSQGGGDESYIGCYRGVYNDTYTYFNGDEVSYTNGGNTSTYRMINDTPCKGIAPTNTVYWQVVAQGSKGEDGTSFNIKGTAKGHYETPNDFDNASGSGSLENGDYLIDKNGSSYHCIAVYEKKPSGPTSTSYKQAEIGDAYILETDGHLYVAVENGWSDVGRIQGTSISIKGNCKGHYVNYTEMAYNADLSDYDVYILDTSFDYSEKFNNEIRKGYDTPSIITYINGPDFRFEVKEANEGDCYIDDSTGHLWQAGSDKWNDLGKIKGDNGVGVSKVEEFYLISSSRTGVTVSTSGWTATVQTPTKDKRYLWNYEKVTYTDGKVENTQPCIIGMYSEDGRGISSISEYYARSTSNSTKPTIWSITPPTLTAIYKYLWNYELIRYTDGTTSKTTPAVIGVYGDTGETGNYTELRFAKNGSTTTPPALTKTSLNPSGWSTAMPSVGTAEYLWMTKAEKNGAGTALISQWTTPVRITPYDGKDGADGKSPAMVYRGNYDSTKTYYGNQYRLDCVKQGGTYYIARIDAGTFSNVAPPNTSKWNEFGAQFESVATQLLLAENANIAGWIFRNNRLESQNGTFYLDGTTGDVNIKGNFVGKISTALNGNRIVINSADNTIIMYTNRNGQDYEVLRIEGEDIGFGLIRPKLTMRELSTSDNSVMATLNISAFEIGFYRYDRTDLPFFAIQGGYTSKRIILGDLALPDSKPSTKGQLYRSGDTIKIVT